MAHGHIDTICPVSYTHLDVYKRQIFALSITPYINASIIINLLTVAIPPLERLSKEGEEGRRKLNRITRYTALGLAVALSVAYYFLLKRQGALLYTGGFAEMCIRDSPGARLDHCQPDRGRSYRHDPLHQARWSGLDQDFPRQAHHRETRRDPHGLR